MKRAMGLVLAILAFAVVTHADGITIVNGHFAARSGDFFESQAFAAGLQSAHRADESGFAVLDASLGDDSAEFDFIRIDGLAGIHDTWRGRLSGFEHSEPFHTDPGLKTVPEPGTLLLIEAGCMALAVRKRCSAFDADYTERAR
ncbi:MAG TPA: PEP-CTERM sorting domain-containing protein [Candidatus Acidoferrales bacterium]|nr:PEP-CTERM sorting domain-containing protein [Candidatus Acidoferrales bacterium]